MNDKYKCRMRIIMFGKKLIFLEQILLLFINKINIIIWWKIIINFSNYTQI